MKTELIAVAVIVVIIIAVGGYYLVSSSGSHSPNNAVTNPTSAYTSTATSYSTSIAPSNASTSVAATSTIAQNKTSNATSSNAYTVNVTQSSTLGTYLTNGTGYTLYYFSGDTANSGQSACNGSCASNWPPFYTATLTLPSSLSASSFSTITRSDGTKQLTYNGMPLYFFKSDTKPGEVNGNGLGGFSVAKTSG